MSETTERPLPTPDDLLQLDQQVCFALAVASRSVIALYRPVLEPLGLTHPQYLVMLALWEQSPRTLGGLGAQLMLESATLTPIVKRLEASGFVVRARSASDERALAIELTDAGRALRAECLVVPQRIIERLGVPIEELERTRDALHVLIDAAHPRAS
ncbi:MarR family transcriptional regulator [Agromyces sp. SYSU K20354]|uniref:MarR family winged helix-turn-helix transcriptional regulator n=1 Tax=Agromyces cavernae TaxID=2898659 RepID=UPI001E4501DA|nr:MarR family transcriptional regulator [Agromyces cavernae]MCD2443172.1 MarR family transcriptional regulator [Agromyces cavernae]